MTRRDWLIVGAGFTGAVLAERIASELDQSVLVIDRRNHIGGNAYDSREDALLVHRYGPHIFHTNSTRVWEYLSRFTEWRPYFHHVLGIVDGKHVPVPFNLNSILALFPPRMADRLCETLVQRYGFGQKVPILKLRAEQEPDLRFLADYVYSKVFEGYTLKQWGMRPEDLGPGVTARVPILISRDDRYFQDRYQAMPRDGYTALFRRLLDHPRITVELGSEYSDAMASTRFDRVIFTGPIDEFFDYSHGPLPYRSLRFERRSEARHAGLPVGTVNYPNEFEFTRISDQRHLSGELDAAPLLITEYPGQYVPGVNEPYYPIPTEATGALLARYQTDATELDGKVFFAGRLGDYSYYNMDQACARALALFEKRIVPLVTRAADAVPVPA
ncbi:MAG TPA: UDP-galactopyranose mutase [Acetobacteraceae bacterium]|jgi:UDP-galactopyranose mutase|nr:UDP-galactopyranose mutase [Acetobacteraceae bacterium]